MAKRSDLVKAWFRQWLQHREIRIAEPSFSEAQCRELSELLTLLDRVPEQTAVSEEDTGPLAEAATSLWRAQRKLTQAGRSAENRQTGRYLRTCAEALAAAGLVVQEHDGTTFNAGRALDVLVYQDDPAMTEETIVETVRPSVYYHDRQIQRGEVIVARPTADESTKVGGDHA
ncbi:hypothetical protein ABZS29_25950 [Kribbella sp. NPDC005582]|uniref:hypothetical protein n=1 Tax=Kribbella sp. NPDC005582 TaxID=3156893 RepID=UPI0033BDA4FF